MNSEDKLRQILQELTQLVNNAAAKQEIEKQISAFISNYNSLQDKVQAEFEQLDSELKKVDAEIVKLDRQFEQIKQLEHKIDSAFYRFSEFVSYVSSDKFQNAIAKIPNLITSINNLQNKHSEIEKALAELNHKIESLKKDLQTARADYEIAYKKSKESLKKAKTFEKLLYAILSAVIIINFCEILMFADVKFAIFVAGLTTIAFVGTYLLLDRIK